MKKLNKKGFTMIEIIVVLAIVAIISSIAIPVAVSQINKANRLQDDVTATNITAAINIESTGTNPSIDVKKKFHEGLMDDILNTIADKELSLTPKESKFKFILEISDEGKNNIKAVDTSKCTLGTKTIDTQKYKREITVSRTLKSKEFVRGHSVISQVQYLKDGKEVAFGYDITAKEIDSNTKKYIDKVEGIYKFSQADGRIVTTYKDWNTFSTIGSENSTYIKVNNKELVTVSNVSSTFDNLSQPELILPSTIEKIGENCFNDTNLRYVYIPSSVKSIDKTSFKNLDKVTEIEYEGSFEKFAKLFDGYKTTEEFYGDYDNWANNGERVDLPALQYLYADSVKYKLSSCKNSLNCDVKF